MKFWRWFLFPFSILYATVMEIRNRLFDSKIFKSYVIPGKSIVIGNLSLGGTGKSPHTLFLWKIFHETTPISFLSRGYGRKTKGLLEVNTDSLPENVGDEPLMFKKRVQTESCVVVSENRENGVRFIREKASNSVILLDDAFQHRKVKAGFQILLTEYAHPFYRDFVVPMGRLRERRKGKNRADIVIVTKCPVTLSESEKMNIRSKINRSTKNVYFSRICYDEIVPFSTKKITAVKRILIVTGIANPSSLCQHLQMTFDVELMAFPDHHTFTPDDLAKIHKKFDTFANKNESIILVTEKDFVKLSTPELQPILDAYPWYYQPITVKIDEEEKFIHEIKKYVGTI